MLSRRSFLNGALGAGAGLALTHPAAAQAPAAQPRPRRIIVDAQVHQWKAQTPERPWPPGRVAQLPEPFGYDKLLPMMNEAGVDRVVIVPPSWEGERNDYALEAAGNILIASPSWAASCSRARKHLRSCRDGRSRKACSASG
jgi:L-fuconolactonase